ncbi:PaaI family thioesterase [Desertibacillus haloalkaliphilus]|uniref:PaaI family thioesterase n=1 Tax=Desertibacillus haloalkaliphilus TaxID=1328930 RepID=UPI001C25B578|nr:PaaI family thioesterase [Desertibacillus haloalkaliphilus]MBU8906172.1 PaaI family thioesterase [Desertibacillus haloalkaliphilus]
MEHGVNRFNEYLGIKVDHLDNSGCTAFLEVKEDLYNSLEGVLHGGVTFTLADVAMGHAASPPENGIQQCVTSELKINYLSPAKGRKLIAESNVIKRGRKLITMEAKIKDEDGKIVAVALGTYARI